MSLTLSVKINVDLAFLAACVRVSQQATDSSSPLPLRSSPTAATFSSKAGIVHEEMSDFYKYTHTDFYGSGTPCIIKTGPSWPIREGIQEQKFIRAARPIYNHCIRPTWLSIAWSIVAKLDSLQVEWNTINPL